MNEYNENHESNESMADERITDDMCPHCQELHDELNEAHEKIEALQAELADKDETNQEIYELKEIRDRLEKENKELKEENESLCKKAIDALEISNDCEFMGEHIVPCYERHKKFQKALTDIKALQGEKGE